MCTELVQLSANGLTLGPATADLSRLPFHMYSTIIIRFFSLVSAFQFFSLYIVSRAFVMFH